VTSLVPGNKNTDVQVFIEEEEGFGRNGMKGKEVLRVRSRVL
jgi:hypothetical protein